MSHFSVSVIVPHDYSNSHVTANDIENCLHRILAPYDEQTEEAEYREFEDRTDEAKADYETDTMRVIPVPGRHYTLDLRPHLHRQVLYPRRCDLSVWCRKEHSGQAADGGI